MYLLWSIFYKIKNSYAKEKILMEKKKFNK